MAAPARAEYSDPTINLLTGLANLGGKKETTNRTEKTTVDPAATDALHSLLTTQLGATTPEGATALLQAIFAQGMREVPGLATTYAQAAGARSGNNSPLTLAMQDLLTRLTQEGAKALSTNQQNASNTAGKLAEATTSKTATQTAATQPKLSMLQILPFVLGQAGKLKGLAGGLKDVLGGGSNVGTGLNTGVNDASSGINFGTSIDNPTGADNLTLATDFGSLSDATANSFSGVGAAGGENGGIDSSIASAGAAAPIDFGDPSNLLDFASGASNLGIDTTNFATPDQADAIFNSIDLGFARGGLVNKKKMMMTKMPGYAKGGMVHAPGYASGGQVGSVSAGRNINVRDASGQEVRGVTYNDSGAGANDSMDLLRAITTIPTVAAAIPTPIRAEQTPAPKKQSSSSGELGADSGASGEGVGLATGQVGDPASNAAAIAGFGAGLLGMTTGIPGIAMGLNALGVPTHSLDPISNIVTAIVNTITTGDPNGAASDVATGNVAAEGLNGMSAPSVSVDGVTTSGQSTTAAMSAPDNGLAGLGLGGTGDAGVGGISGNSGDNAGDSEGSGDASGSGDSLARGGSVNGPGTSTSDSIVARLSDGEYVVNAKAVQALGAPFFDAINSMFGNSLNSNNQQGATRGR